MPRMTEQTKRVHVVLYADDWEQLGVLVGDSVARGQVIRALVRNYVRSIRARVDQKQAAQLATNSASVAGETEEKL